MMSPCSSVRWSSFSKFIAFGEPVDHPFPGKITGDQEGQAGADGGADIHQDNSQHRAEKGAGGNSDGGAGQGGHHRDDIDQKKDQGTPGAQGDEPIPQGPELFAHVEDLGQDEDGNKNDEE